MSIILGDDAKILLKTSSTIAYMSALVFSLLHNTGGLVPPSSPDINNYKQRRYIVIKIKPRLHPVIIITWASYKCRHCDSWDIRTIMTLFTHTIRVLYLMFITVYMHSSIQRLQAARLAAIIRNIYWEIFQESCRMKWPQTKMLH